MSESPKDGLDRRDFMIASIANLIAVWWGLGRDPRPFRGKSGHSSCEKIPFRKPSVTAPRHLLGILS